MKNILTIMMVCIGMSAISQERFHLSQYGANQEYYNPSVISSYNELNVGILWRNQWTGLDGAPSVGMVDVFAPIGEGTSTIGAMLVYDKIGFNTRTIFNGMYSYKVQLTKGHYMSIGGAMGLKYNAQDITELDVDPDDTYFMNNVQNTLGGDGNLGVYFFGDGYYAGISGTNIFDAVHFNLSGGYVVRLNQSFDLIPSVLIKGAVAAPVQADINVQGLYNKMIGIGMSYRTSGDFIVMADLKLNQKLRFGYAYDHNLKSQGIGRAVSGSHELFLRYSFKESGTLAKIFVPRF